jgi:hypothetical protein
LSWGLDDMNYIIETLVRKRFSAISLPLEDFASSVPSFLAHLWQKSEDHPWFIVTLAQNVSLEEEIANPSEKKNNEFYKYNENVLKTSCPPFTQLTQQEVLFMISNWLTSLFEPKNVPGTLSQSSVINNIFAQLEIELLKMDIKVIKEPGLAFTHGYFYVNHTSNLLRLIPHSHLNLVTQVYAGEIPIELIDPIDRDLYRLVTSQPIYPSISTGARLDRIYNHFKNRSGKITQEISQSAIEKLLTTININFLTFIANLCETDPFKIFVFRSLSQRVLMAPVEGHQYNQGFWLYGVSGTAKNSWINCLTTLANGKVAEITDVAKQFPSLTNKNLCSILDLDDVTPMMVNWFKTTLGRDRVQMGAKFENASHSVPYCQVVITSNKNPWEISTIKNNKEFLVKLVMLEFTQQIPRQFMLPSLGPVLNKHMVPYFLWSLFMPREWLEQQIRGSRFQNYLLAQKRITLNLLQRYIIDRYFIPDLSRPGRFNTKSNVLTDVIRADFTDWEESQNEKVDYQKKTRQAYLSLLPGEMAKEMNSNFFLQGTPNEISKDRPREGKISVEVPVDDQGNPIVSKSKKSSKNKVAPIESSITPTVIVTRVKDNRPYCLSPLILKSSLSEEELKNPNCNIKELGLIPDIEDILEINLEKLEIPLCTYEIFQPSKVTASSAEINLTQQNLLIYSENDKKLLEALTRAGMDEKNPENYQRLFNASQTGNINSLQTSNQETVQPPIRKTGKWFKENQSTGGSAIPNAEEGSTGGLSPLNAEDEGTGDSATPNAVGKGTGGLTPPNTRQERKVLVVQLLQQSPFKSLSSLVKLRVWVCNPSSN